MANFEIETFPIYTPPLMYKVSYPVDEVVS